MSDFENIPSELRERDQWLFWNASNDTPRAPLDSPAATYGCSWSDPDTWMAFDDVAERAAATPNAGIGFVNAADNDDYARGIVGSIDIDGVAEEPHGSPKDWLPSLQPFFDRDVYIEWSPSGEGLRIPIVGIEVPDWWSDQHFSDEEHEGVEVLTNKFSTYTGDELRGCGDAVAEYGAWLDEWLREVYKAITGEDPVDERQAEIADSVTDGSDDTPGEEWLTADVAEEALDHIDPDSAYSVWRDVGMALVNKFGSRGESMFESWSRRGSKWDSDAKEQAERIATDAGNYQYDAGTIIHYAQDGGWDASAAAREQLGGRPAASSEPEFDVVASESDHDEQRSETDGGTAAATPGGNEPRTRFERFRDDVQSAIDAVEDDDDLTQRTARHRMAEAFDRYYDFVFPEEEVRGWRTNLYVYAEDDGIYEPRGEAFVAKQLEKAAGDYVTNQVVNEIVGKLERMSTERGPAFEGAPERLVVGNGILDLHTGELESLTPTEYHRKKVDIDWNPDAGEPHAIDDFLHDIVADDDVGTLYRLIAHSLYKEYVGEKAAMLIGSGQNGKSVFLDLVEQFLGQYNVSHRSLQAFEDKFAANALEGKLANIHPDMGDSDVTDLSQFKKLTGRDTFQADVKFESPVEFENYATLMFAANEMPVFDEDNHAVWRRWLYLDFPYTFDADDPGAKDPEPKRVLMRRLTTDDQLEGLLYRCQQEIERWYNGEPWYPDAMEPSEVREQMKKAAEPVYDFAMTCLVDVEHEDDDGVWLPKNDVRQAYREYAAEEQLPTMGEEQFGERLLGLADLNIDSGRPTDENGNRPRAYMGVTWSERGRQLLGLDEPDDEDQSTVGGVSSTKGRVLEIVRDLVAEKGAEPVDRSLVVGRAMGSMGMATAEKRVDDLLKSGDLYEPEDGKLIDT